MDLRQLEVFINLAESLNYSKTAENLHLSQPRPLAGSFSGLKMKLASPFFTATTGKYS